VKKEEKSKIAKALGASRVVDVDTKQVRGPLDLLALRDEFSRRLRSTGGRPTDPEWTVTRQVPFKEDSWKRLQGLASDVGATGRRVGPAQVAALLIENSLDEIEEAHWQEALTQSRMIPPLSQPDAAEAAGVTYNQFDDWVQRSWIVPAGRKGRQRSFSADEVVRARWLRSISGTAADIETIATLVRGCDLTDRYLLVTNADEVLTAPGRSQLHRLLERPGSHLVIDQLPERRTLIGLPPFPDDADDERRARRAV
jgi:DNA-binding transcriptional MerR regulator